ncbi:response regulator [Aquincola tertiaricarbonis]|uniref:Response regulator n=1 Tax=Aquincola tertiaricarbonis TaxID=391953 RepID=A0ABY4S5K8_AQUTE|nr:response regulator [Aquincola tertiaricarbonis]URI08716.1 response regulator [Aquincola tertiaricarbonis]
MNAKTTSTAEEATTSAFYTTIETARLLGLAVRSVQLMVDRGELEAWKTPGGHRRISKVSVERWIAVNRMNVSSGSTGGTGRPESRAPRVLLVEDSSHFQNLVSLLVREQYPEVELHVADDGIAGLAMYGQLQPQVLIVDILLPGIDGATLIASLRSHPQFANSELIVMTSLDEQQRAPYAFALAGVPVAHKLQLVAQLNPLLRKALAPHLPRLAASAETTTAAE